MSAGARRRRRKVHTELRPPRVKQKKCATTGKAGFATEADALAVAVNLSRKAAVKRVYECEFCSRWHLTSQEKKR